VTEAPRTPEGEPEPDAVADPGPPRPGADHPPETGEDGTGLGRPAAEPSPDRVETMTTDESVEEQPDDELAAARVALAERTQDLQRLQAEFVNYKRRVERDRPLLEQNATYRVLTPIIEVLDTIDRAREHGDLDEGFTAVAEQLERVVSGLGLTKFGAPGDPFDPNLHEALSHVGEDPGVEVTTCKVVAKAGYRIGDRVVRAAQVLVVDPAGG
jgi:molecular chaperone GrpE